MSSGNMNLVGLGLTLGVGIGIVIGTVTRKATGNLGIWVALGVAFGPGVGLVIGAALQARRTRNEENNQETADSD